MNLKKVNLCIAVTVIAAVLLTACGTTAAPKTTDVSVRLKWLHSVQFAGNYVAAAENYYAAAGLNVTIDPINFDDIAGIEELVVNGKNTFGIDSAEQIILARSKGLPVRAVAVIFRTSPLVLVSMDNIAISRPSDLVGMTVAAHAGQAILTYETMMQNAGVDMSQVKFVEPTTFNALDCLATADVCSAYSTDGVVEMELKGHTAHTIWPNEYGVPFYADVIFTTDEYIAQHPEEVAAFVQATLKGWQSAIENPTLAVDDTMKFDPNLDRDFQLASMKATIPLVDTGTIQLGLMEDNIWQTMHDILLQQNIIAAPVDLSQVYTNEFLNTK